MAGFERAVPDPAMLARLMRELDTPMEQHDAMIETIDTMNAERFQLEIELDPEVRSEWEQFIFTDHSDRTEDDF